MTSLKCYICLTDSIVSRADYLDLLRVTLISARKNTTLRLVCLYDGQENDPVYNLLQAYEVEIILHSLPYKQALMDIYPHEWMLRNWGKVVDYSRIFGTFMRMEIPAIEQEEEYVLYADIDVLFATDILPEELPRPAYVAAAPEFERDVTKMTNFNAGVLVMNVTGMRPIYREFLRKMELRERNASGILDQGYLNELCSDKLEPLPIEYNWKPYWGINKQAKIVHYHGMKPSCELSEAGFNTDRHFYRNVFDSNPEGYAGYVYYFSLFYQYLDREEDLWLYRHLQGLFDLYRDPSFAFPQYNEKDRRRYKKYKRLYKLFLGISGLLLLLLLFLLMR